MSFTPITITHPSLSAEWDYEANGDLLPENVSKGMVKKIHWRCIKGHPYEARVDHRCSMKSGCPYCAHKKPFPSETDLKTIYPEIAAEWDYETNDDNLEEYLPQSNKVKNWTCPICRRSYAKKIIDRTVNQLGCPNCTKPGERSTSQQEQAFVFYLKKKTEVLNREKVYGFEVDIYLPKKNAGIEYHGEFYHLKRVERDAAKRKTLVDKGTRLITVTCGRVRGVCKDTVTMLTKPKANPTEKELTWAIKEVFQLLEIDCPDINLSRDRSKIYAQYIGSIKANSLERKFPELASEWNYEMNECLTPGMFQYGSHAEVWWTCPKCNNAYDMVIYNRTIGGQNCPYCSKPIKRIKIGFNDLATTHPDLSVQWHPFLNGDKTPLDYTAGSREKPYWLCPACGYTWRAAICSRCAGKGCPCCSGRVVVPGINDLETKNPFLAAEWHPTMNGEKTPGGVTPGKQKKAWWLCSICGHEWEAVIAARNRGNGCPECKRKRKKQPV